MIRLENNKSFVDTIIKKYELSFILHEWLTDTILQSVAKNSKDVTNLKFSNDSCVRINGEGIIDFDMVLIRLSCDYYCHYEKKIINIHNNKISGIKIRDLFRIYCWKMKMVPEKFDIDHNRIYEKVMKANPDYDLAPILGFLSKHNQSLHLINDKSKLDHNVQIFANHVILFPETTQWHQLILHQKQYKEKFFGKKFLLSC